MARAADEGERALHERLLARDPTAPSDLMERYLEPVLRRLLGSRERGPDSHLFEDAAIEALMSYSQRPQQYQPERLSLASYLLMAAKSDLSNFQRGEFRHIGRSVALDESPAVEVALWRLAGNDSVEEQALEGLEMDLPGGLSRSEALRLIETEFPDPVDRRLLALRFAGERKTTPFAKLLGVSHLSQAEQRAAVKRAKDRLDKRVQRLRARVMTGEGQAK